MQRSILILSWLLFPCLIRAQPGFNITPEFVYPRNQFRNLIVQDDTIVGYGIARMDTSPFQQCLFLARFDTSGTPLDSKLICDSLGESFTMGINWSDLVLTSDDGYALTGSAFDRHNGIFVKLRHDLSVEFVQEYPDSVNFVELYNSIVELPDGYLLGGYVQRSNFLIDAFLRRVDKQGNSIWFSYYGDYEVYDLFPTYCRLNDTLIAYAGGYEKNPNTVAGTGPWIHLVNPDGEVIKEWLPDDDVPIDVIHYLHPVSPDKWILYGINTVEGPDPFKYQSFLALLDTNFQILEVRPFDPIRTPLSFFWDIEPTPDGNFIAAGQFTAINPNVEPDIYGRLFKFSPDLDSLWSLKLTAPISNVQQSGNYLGGVGVLSSGNMVAGGYSQSGNDIYCWLVKFTPDGCVDTLWCVTTPVWEPVDLGLQKQVKVWPNPADDFINVEISEPSEAETVLYDLQGRAVRREQLVGRATLSSASLPAGLYFLEVRAGHRVIARRKVAIAH